MAPLEIATQPGSGNVLNLPVGYTREYDTAPLNPGTYYIRLRSMNISGISPPSAEVSVTISAQVPSAPLNLQAAVNGAVASLQWTAPAGGSPVSDYILEAGTGGGLSDLYNTSVGSVTSLSAQALPGVYFVRVRARNGFGTSAPSNEIVVTIGSSLLPGAPLNPQFSVAPGGVVTIAWTTPGAGGPVVDYVLEAGSAPGGRDLAVMPVGSTTIVTVSSVPSGTYHVRIRARNGAGVGPPSVDIVIVVR